MADNKTNPNRKNPNVNRNRNPQNRGSNPNMRPNPQQRARRQVEEEKPVNNGLSPTIKGIIAIMLTLLVVVVVIMIFASTLFINRSTGPKKTGTITSTEYIPPKTTTTQETVTSKTTSRTTKKEDDEDPYDGVDDGEGVEISCTSAVYLHPEPSSSSENLLTIPSGATCTFYRNENGWYYVDYNGTRGYAWQTFFTTPVTSATTTTVGFGY